MSGLVLHRRLARLNEIEVFYRDTATSLPPVLLLHGRWGRGETWLDLIGRYHDRYRLIAPDLRGHGLSEKPVDGYSSDDLAEDAHALLEFLDCGPAVVVGHSLGGRIAANLAGKYPEVVRALVVLDEHADGAATTPDIAPDELPAVDDLTAEWPLPYPSYEAALAHLRETFPLATNQRYFLESLVETVDGYDFLFSRRAMAAIGALHQGWRDLLPRFKCSVLLVRAAESWCLSAEEAEIMRSLIPDCTCFEVSGSDHMVYADNPGEFYAGFEAFLARIEDGG